MEEVICVPLELEWSYEFFDKILRGQGKTQRDLARALNKSESEISKWLTG